MRQRKNLPHLCDQPRQGLIATSDQWIQSSLKQGLQVFERIHLTPWAGVDHADEEVTPTRAPRRLLKDKAFFR
jgi:hypothetical protein